MPVKASSLYRNTTSYLGGLVVLTSAGLTLLSFLLGLVLPRASPYLGIITYLVFPFFMVVGIVIVLYGMRRESMRRRRSGASAAPPYPRVDLNEPRTRKRFTYVLVGGVLLTTILTFAAYNAFLFTESVTFCGRLCHTVMQPEYTTYQRSPHARVACVDCHVGAGASWYVRSKLSGVRQVFSTVLDTYPRPIPTPVENLRPARDTCEHCHWPEKFFGAQLMQLPHFRYDEKSTAEQLTLLIKTGGGSRASGVNAGIHWHMVVGNRVDFVALDRGLEKIPWIRVERVNGSTAVYTTPELPTPASTSAPHRTDCIDCHNRPTHVILDPERAIDQELMAGRLPRDLPWIKQAAVEALLSPAATQDSDGLSVVRAHMTRFYAKKYPELATSRAGAIAVAASVVAEVRAHNVFPPMNVGFATYPRHIGHRDWPGCFRCHDGKHVAADGKVLTRDCGVCHTVPMRGALAPLGVATHESAAWHAFALKGAHVDLLCPACHQAGRRTSSDCATCHAISAAAPMMGSMACGDCHVKEQERLPVKPCAGCHTELKGLHREQGHQDAACTACHQPHGWLVTGRRACLACHEDKTEHHAEQSCIDCHAFTK